MSEKLTPKQKLESRFNGLAYVFGHAKSHNERVGSWDSLRAYDNALDDVDAVLDQYNRLRFEQMVELGTIPDSLPEPSQNLPPNVELGQD